MAAAKKKRDLQDLYLPIADGESQGQITGCGVVWPALPLPAAAGGNARRARHPHLMH